ncbi:hypothetical protein ACFX13_009239 [Malus domestica]
MWKKVMQWKAWFVSKKYEQPYHFWQVDPWANRGVLVLCNRDPIPGRVFPKLFRLALTTIVVATTTVQFPLPCRTKTSQTLPRLAMF